MGVSGLVNCGCLLEEGGVDGGVVVVDDGEAVSVAAEVADGDAGVGGVGAVGEEQMGAAHYCVCAGGGVVVHDLAAGSAVVEGFGELMQTRRVGRRRRGHQWFRRSEDDRPQADGGRFDSKGVSECEVEGFAGGEALGLGRLDGLEGGKGGGGVGPVGGVP